MRAADDEEWHHRASRGSAMEDIYRWVMDKGVKAFQQGDDERAHLYRTLATEILDKAREERRMQDAVRGDLPAVSR